jgi:hypothetical protein
MGTRAMISIDGKPTFTTHWDGYPTSLGRDLVNLRKKDISSIMRVAAKYSINFADKRYLKQSDALMKRTIRAKPKAERFGYAWAFKKGAHFVNDIKFNDDFQEWEYNIDTKITVRPLSGSWKEHKALSEWKELKKTNLERLEKLV